MHKTPENGAPLLPRLLSVAELATHAEISVTKVRHYERLGLLQPVRISRFRFFLLADVGKLQRISELRKLGLPLKSILPIIGQLPPDGSLAAIPCVTEAVKYHDEKRARRLKKSEL